MTVTVSPGQTLIDISMQGLGDAGRVVEIALLNNLSPSASLTPGSTLELPETDPSKVFVARVLNRLKPATTKCMVNNTGGEGIGFWRVGENFIVG